MRISDWSSDVCSSDLVSERQIKDKQTAGEWHLAVSFYLTVGDVGEAITVRSYDAPASGAKARVKAEDYQRRCRPCCAKPAPSVPGGSRHVDAMLAPLDFARAERRLRMDLTQLLPHFVGDFIIAPDGLDIIVVIERVDQLKQLLRRALLDVDHRLRLPGELCAFRFAEHGFKRFGNFVQGILRGPDFV